MEQLELHIRSKDNYDAMVERAAALRRGHHTWPSATRVLNQEGFRSRNGALTPNVVLMNTLKRYPTLADPARVAMGKASRVAVQQKRAETPVQVQVEAPVQKVGRKTKTKVVSSGKFEQLNALLNIPGLSAAKQTAIIKIVLKD